MLNVYKDRMLFVVRIMWYTLINCLDKTPMFIVKSGGICIVNWAQKVNKPNFQFRTQSQMGRKELKNIIFSQLLASYKILFPSVLEYLHFDNGFKIALLKTIKTTDEDNMKRFINLCVVCLTLSWLHWLLEQ